MRKAEMGKAKFLEWDEARRALFWYTLSRKGRIFQNFCIPSVPTEWVLILFKGSNWCKYINVSYDMPFLLLTFIVSYILYILSFPPWKKPLALASVFFWKQVSLRRDMLFNSVSQSCEWRHPWFSCLIKLSFILHLKMNFFTWLILTHMSSKRNTVKDSKAN